MYIWRGKNRRDKRNLLLLGEQGWTADDHDKNHNEEDERLRYGKEKQHVEYFSKRIRHLMEKYLETEEGGEEINCLRRELELARRQQRKLMDTAEHRLNEADMMKKNVLEIFRRFSIPGSEIFTVSENGEKAFEGGFLNEEGLQNMLAFLSIHLSNKQLKKYKDRLHFDDIKVTVSFEEFYGVFLSDLRDRGKPISAYITSLFKGKLKRQREQMTEMDQLEEEEAVLQAENSTNVSWFLQMKLRSVEARVILIDEAVAIAEELATKEFRIAHPPVFHCEQCNGSFPSKDFFNKHRRDEQFHREFFRKQVAQEEQFRLVKKIFEGDKSRRLWANRLIFSAELGTQQLRVDLVRKDPFRPSLSDPEGKKHDQLLRGMYVTGFDPKSGIRANYRRNGMKQLANISQTDQEKEAEWLLFQRNPTKLPSKPSLHEIVLVLNRCNDEIVDVVSTLDHPDVRDLSDTNRIKQENMMAFVRFEWSGTCQRHVSIVAEFTNWKPVRMEGDPRTDVFYHHVELAVGMYRYRFMIDGIEEKVDEHASQIEDAKSPIGVNNVLMVTNAAIGKAKGSRAGGLFQVDRKNLKFGRSSNIPKLRGSKTQREDEDEDEDDDGSKSVNTLLTDDSNLIETGNQSQSRDIPGKIYHISQKLSDVTASEELVSQIRSLDLRNMTVQDDGCWALGSAFKRNHYVETIDLSFNNISDEGIQALSGGLEKCLALHTLKLNGNGFGVDACRYLVEAFTNTKLSDSSQRHNDNDEDDIVSAAISLGKSSKFGSSKSGKMRRMKNKNEPAVVPHARFLRLQHLELSQNRIGCDGMEIWAKFLQHSSHRLQELYLDSCYIGDDGALALSEALNRNRWLITLSLMHNNIQENGSCVLAKALFFNASLKHLALSHNPLGPKGVKWLGDMLYRNDSLESLALRHVYMVRGNNAMGLEAVCYGLKHAQALTLHSGDVQMRGIKKLDLSHNDLRDNHIIDLAHALTMNTTLTELILDSNHFTSAKWWDPEKHVRTHILSEMPTLAMSLQKNRQLQQKLVDQGQAIALMLARAPPSPANAKVTKAQAQQQAQQANSGYIVDDVPVGYWSVRRQWKSLKQDEEVRRQRLVAESKELERIQKEHARLMKELQHYLRGVAHYIDQEDDDGYAPCLEDITALAHVLRHHIENLIYFDPDEFRMHDIRRQSKPSWSKTHLSRQNSMMEDDFVTLDSDYLDRDTDFWDTDYEDEDDKRANRKKKASPVKFIYTGKKMKGKQPHRLLEPECDPVLMQEIEQDNKELDDDENGEDAVIDKNKKPWFLPRILGISSGMTEFERQQKIYGAEERREALLREHRAHLARQHIPNVGMFMDCHMSLMSAIFIILSGQKVTVMPMTVLELHPERLMQCLNMLGMPLYLLDLFSPNDNISKDGDSNHEHCEDISSASNNSRHGLSDIARQQRSLQSIADATMLHADYTAQRAQEQLQDRLQPRPGAPEVATRKKLDITNITKNIAGRAVRTTHPMIALHRLADYLLRHIHRQGIDAPPGMLSLLLHSYAVGGGGGGSDGRRGGGRVSSLRNLITRTQPLADTTAKNQERFHLQRMRLLADLSRSPPITEARTILLDTLRHRAFQSLQTLSADEHPALLPHYICSLCKSRFTSGRLLYKHMKEAKMFETHHVATGGYGEPVRQDDQQPPHRRHKKKKYHTYHEMVGNLHRRFAFKEALQAGQYRLLVSALETKLGLSLPAYFELSEIDTVYAIKDEFYPQICDTLGNAGRPKGIVESYRTVRVEFALGDYLLVNMRQEYGWVKYRYRIPGTGGKHSAVPAQFIPLLRPLPGFDWKTAGGRAIDCYYRVNDNLPSHIQLKVRYRPYLTEPNLGEHGSQYKKKNGERLENVLGYIGKEDVVYARYILGDWLQIRFHDEYVAWILFRLPKPATEPAVASPNKASATSSMFASPVHTKSVHDRMAPVPGTPSSLIMVAGDYGTVSMTSMKIREVVSSPDKTMVGNNGGSPAFKSSLLPPDRLGGFADTSSPSSPPDSPFRNVHASNNITVSNIVRQRKLDHADVPIAVTANNADIIFQDDIITYELNGKFLRTNLLKPDNQISRFKVHVFDRLRYGNPEVSLPDIDRRDKYLKRQQQLELRTYDGLGNMTDHLLRVPIFLQYLLVDAESSGQDRDDDDDDDDDDMGDGKEGHNKDKKVKTKMMKTQPAAKVAKKVISTNAERGSKNETEEKETGEAKRAAAIEAVNREENIIIRSPVKLSQEEIFKAVIAMSDAELRDEMNAAFIAAESEEDHANRYSFVRDEIYGVMDSEDSWQPDGNMG
jgi:Ran GTPase-activating protein (RanGAP) involved in mRNA processing and transport